MRHQNSKLNLNIDKKILFLNVCFEFPVGQSNKDKSEEVIVLSLVDLMIIIDLMEDKLLGEPRVKDIIKYLFLRRRTLGFATDDEVVIAITLLYYEFIDRLIESNSLGKLHMDSSESVSNINQLYSLLSSAKDVPNSEVYNLVKDNYKGFLLDYVIGHEQR